MTTPATVQNSVLKMISDSSVTWAFGFLSRDSNKMAFMEYVVDDIVIISEQPTCMIILNVCVYVSGYIIGGHK